MNALIVERLLQRLPLPDRASSEAVVDALVDGLAAEGLDATAQGGMGFLIVAFQASGGGPMGRPRS